MVISVCVYMLPNRAAIGFENGFACCAIVEYFQVFVLMLLWAFRERMSEALHLNTTCHIDQAPNQKILQPTAILGWAEHDLDDLSSEPVPSLAAFCLEPAQALLVGRVHWNAAATASHTAWACSAVMVGHMGSESSCAARASATGKLPWAKGRPL